MRKSVFRYRGIETVVDTMKSAEFDAAGYQIPPATLEKIGANLLAEPSSPRDQPVKAFSVRELFGYDVLFLMTLREGKAVLTIVHIHPVDPNVPLRARLRVLERIATLRSATGL